jgi:hypothetical protein
MIFAKLKYISHDAIVSLGRQNINPLGSSLNRLHEHGHAGMKLRRIFMSLIAGLGASTVHLALMELKVRTGLLPTFDPYTDLQRLLASLLPLAPQTPGAWLLPTLNGSMLLGFLFGQLFPYLPGRSAWIKGGVFGIFSWLLLGLVLLPWAGIGIFAARLDLGVKPALLMLAMLSTYAITVSVLYSRLIQSATSRNTA